MIEGFDKKRIDANSTLKKDDRFFEPAELDQRRAIKKLQGRRIRRQTAGAQQNSRSARWPVLFKMENA
jgi:hypothetical protein